MHHVFLHIVFMGNLFRHIVGWVCWISCIHTTVNAINKPRSRAIEAGVFWNWLVLQRACPWWRQTTTLTTITHVGINIGIITLLPFICFCNKYNIISGKISELYIIACKLLFMRPSQAIVHEAVHQYSRWSMWLSNSIVVSYIVIVIWTLDWAAVSCIMSKEQIDWNRGLP